jgi:hypothetical protein
MLITQTKVDVIANKYWKNTLINEMYFSFLNIENLTSK